MRRLSLLLAAPFLLTGCFAGGAEPAAATGDARLRVALAFLPTRGMSPHSDDAVRLSQLGVIEGLTRLDEDGAARPALATEWRRTADRTWTFTLRPATFHDGTAVTAAAVADALRRANAATPRLRVLTGLALTATATGPDTVAVSTDVADTLLPQRMSSPTLGILAPSAYAGSQPDPIRAATGPFVLTEVRGAQGVAADRFDGYWGEPARAAGLDVEFVSDGTTRANALRTRAVDVVDTIPIAQAAVLDRATLHEVPTMRTVNLLLNTAKGTFAEPAARAAARVAVRPRPIVEGVYEGRADTAQGLFGPALPWAARQRVTPERRAPGAVAGRTVVLATYTNRPELPEIATVVQRQLEEAGFAVRQEVREYSRLEADALAGTFDAVILSRSAALDTGDPVSYLASDFTCAGSYNIAQLCDPAVDRAVSEAGAAGNGATRQTAIMRAEAAIIATDAAVPLLHERVVQGVASGVTGVLPDARERTLVGAGTYRS
ncbi:ABC transporter substrate-binding protein [Micromonospora sp. CPCC 206061]|uniref:ABC transporter substrate-binding protein n=1 Tax=Micromonospora sp. CPCC 206061 TaxID=3122410 RepID=UPI002FEF1D39